MYPFLFGSIPSYTVMMIVGVLAAVACFRIISDKTKLPAKIYNYYSMNAVISIAAGLLSAMLFQSVYNYFETGVFKLEGMTFYGRTYRRSGYVRRRNSSRKSREVKRSFFVRRRNRRALRLSRARAGTNRLYSRGVLLRNRKRTRLVFPFRRQKSYSDAVHRSVLSVRAVCRSSRLYDKTTSARI